MAEPFAYQNTFTRQSLMEFLEASLLDAIPIKVVRIEPALIGLFERRPFAVDDGEPGRIPVPSLHHEMLAENALEGEAETQRGTLRGFVVVVAFPFIATVAQVIEDMTHEKELRLRRRRLSRHWRRSEERRVGD